MAQHLNFRPHGPAMIANWTAHSSLSSAKRVDSITKFNNLPEPAQSSVLALSRKFLSLRGCCRSNNLS